MMTPSLAVTTDAKHVAEQGLVVFLPVKQVRSAAPGGKYYLPGIALIIVAVSCLCSVTNAAEIASFRTTDIESHVELRYLFDERTQSNAGIESFSNRQITYEEEFSVLTRNYVYHPNFLKLDLGAGVTFVQDSFETNTGSNDNNDDLYSLLARASLLETKPYPTTIYYTRVHPTISFSSLADPIRQTNTRYGIDMALLEPLIPLKINLFASHNEENGSSPTELVDDSDDRYGIRLSKVYSENYSQRLSFEHTEEDSASGSLALPIIPTSHISDLLLYSSDWRIGAQQQIHYSDAISVSRQSGAMIRDEVSFDPNLVWKHSDKAESSYSYRYRDTTQDGIDTTNQSATASLDYKYNQRIDYDAEVRVEDDSTTGVDKQSIGAKGGIDYRRLLTIGMLRLGASLDYSQNDRDATAALANVIGEIITLSGLTPVALGQEFIIPASIVVRDLALSQTFVDGIDYRVIVVGTRTEIQRLSGSNIGDPEQVSVDYAYQTGGNAGYTSLIQYYQADLSTNRYDLYLRYETDDQDLNSGSPTLPLNSYNRWSSGAGLDYPLNRWVEVGANVNLVRHDEDISPYDSERYSVFGQFILSSYSDLRLTANQSIIDNLNTVEDTDLTSFSLVFRSRPLNRMLLSAEAYTEEDTGGTIFRKKDDFRFTAQWQLYQLSMNAQVFFSNEQTGTTETEEATIMLTIRRDI